MKKFLSALLLLLITSTCQADTSLGYSKSNTWGDHGALVNLQNTNITGPASSDGYMVLGFGATDYATDYDNLTGWTLYGTAVEEISPAGQFHFYCNNQNAIIFRAYASFGANTTTLTLMKYDSHCTSTSAPPAGSWFSSGITDHSLNYSLRSDGTYFDVYCRNGTKHDTTVPIDNRFHIFGMYDSTSGSTGTGILDGIELFKDGEREAALNAEFDIGSWGGSGELEYHQDWLKHWNSITPWTTSDAKWTSTYNDAIFDAGAGNQWKSITWDATTANGTTITAEARCAATSAGLSSATYNAVTMGVDLTAKGEWVQTIMHFNSAGSGQYTPVLKSMTMTTEEGGAQPEPPDTGASGTWGSVGL